MHTVTAAQETMSVSASTCCAMPQPGYRHAIPLPEGRTVAVVPLCHELGLVRSSPPKVAGLSVLPI